MQGAKLFSRGPRLAYLTGAAAAAGALLLHAAAAGGSMAAAAVQAGLVVLLIAVGPGSMYVVADDAGVTVRNVLRTHRIPWSEVHGFSLDEGYPYLGRLETADGSEISVLAISDEPWLVRESGHLRNIEILEGLNRAWRAAVVQAQSGMPAPLRPAVGVTSS